MWLGDDSVFTDANTSLGVTQSQAASSDVSTERRPGTFTNQQVPKNLTADESTAEAALLSSVTTEAVAAVTSTKLAEGLLKTLPNDLEQLGSDVSAVLVNATAGLNGILNSTTGAGSVRQQLERVLDTGEETDSVQDDFSLSEQGKLDLHGNVNGIGIGQYNSSSKRLRESTRMSQLFGVFGAVLVFALWMLRRRRKPQHSHSEPGLLGPGVDQGVGGWLRPRSGRHRLATA